VGIAQSAAAETLIAVPEGASDELPVIELTGLTKRFGSVTALDHIDARISGRVIGLLGPNGAGKSTLLKCLLGVLPFEGTATVLGLSSARDGAQIRDRVGYLPEQDATMLGLDAVQLCAFVGELSGLPHNEAVQRAHAALDHVGFDDKRYQRVDNYSTGQKQRVKLAQALVHGPDLLFLDEPTSGLHPRARDEMLALVGDLPRRCGCVVVLSTHLLPDVERICDHAVIMHGGQVEFVGSVDELRRTTRAYAIEVALGADRAAEALNQRGATCRVLSATRLAIELPGDATTSWLFDVAHELGIQIRGLEIERETIEAAFLRVIARDRGHAA
jgi:ABC-2 type transport system ATP-binding protein